MPIININATTRISKEGNVAQIQVIEEGKWVSKSHRVLDGKDHWPTIQKQLQDSLIVNNKII